MEKSAIDFYDIIIKSDSLLSLKKGWEINFSQSGMEKYKSMKNARCCVVGVLGIGNKGKTFLLQRISGCELYSGYSVKTEGLSLLYPKNTTRKIICLDTAGQETPLMALDRDECFKTMTEAEKYEMISSLARDRQLTELFLQSFVIQESHVILAVVGQLSKSDQKLLSRIKKECKVKRKQLFIVHNLNTLQTRKEIEDYIEESLMKSLTFKLIKNHFINLNKNEEALPNNNQIYYTEAEFLSKKHSEGKDNDDDQFDISVVHLIIALEDSEAGRYYNQVVYNFLKEQMGCQSAPREFPVVDRVVKHLIKMSKTLMEEPLESEADLRVEERCIAIKKENIQLKKCLVDELGTPNFFGKAFIPKYSYDIDVEKNEFIVSFELNGTLSELKCGIKIIGENYEVKITGVKTLNEKADASDVTSTKESGNFIIEFRISVHLIQFKATKISHKLKEMGVYTLYFPLQDQKIKNKEQEIVFDQAPRSESLAR